MEQSAVTLIYPAYVFWPSAIAFHEIEDAEDIEYCFEFNDIQDENLVGWDSEGKRFTLAWDKKRSCGFPVPEKTDLAGLEEKVTLFNQHRSDDHTFFAKEEIVDGECSPRVINRFLKQVQERLGPKS